MKYSNINLFKNREQKKKCTGLLRGTGEGI